MMKNTISNRGIVGSLKEGLRKGIVSVKRNPSVIPMIFLVAAFLVYSLNLTNMSDTTAKIQGQGMGLCQFCIMLFSLLSMLCMLNAFPRRQKPNYLMIVVMFVMFAILLYCDYHYSNAILAALNRAESPIVLNESTKYIANAFNMLGMYQILICVSAGLVVLLPVYSKWIRKINTSVRVEDNGDMGQIEIED